MQATSDDDGTDVEEVVWFFNFCGLYSIKMQVSRGTADNSSREKRRKKNKKEKKNEKAEKDTKKDRQHKEVSLSPLMYCKRDQLQARDTRARTGDVASSTTTTTVTSQQVLAYCTQIFMTP